MSRLQRFDVNRTPNLGLRPRLVWDGPSALKQRPNSVIEGFVLDWYKRALQSQHQAELKLVWESPRPKPRRTKAERELLLNENARNLAVSGVSIIDDLAGPVRYRVFGASGDLTSDSRRVLVLRPFRRPTSNLVGDQSFGAAVTPISGLRRSSVLRPCHRLNLRPPAGSSAKETLEITRLCMQVQIGRFVWIVGQLVRALSTSKNSCPHKRKRQKPGGLWRFHHDNLAV